jgi:hypothetical protein
VADTTRSVAEIREHFTRRLNDALLRPGMYGGEIVVRGFLGDLAWIDGREPDGGGVSESLEAAGAWSANGVAGVFARMFVGQLKEHEEAAVFVYADLARAWGYLVPQRKLPVSEYSRLRDDARAWTASSDRVLADVIGAFGVPSLWRPKYNPRFPASVGYVSESQADPLVVFDFWQEWAGPGHQSRFGPEPVLRDVWWREGQLTDGLTVSPIGRVLLASDDHEKRGNLTDQPG